MKILETLSEDPENAWDWIEERAAILEFDGQIRHHEANHKAFELWFRRYVEDIR